MTTTIDIQALAELHARYVALAAQIEPLQQEMDELKAKTRSMAPLGTTNLATGSIIVSPNRRFSPDHAAAVLPADIADQCSETVITAKKAKRVLAPALYDACLVEIGESKVTFR